MLNKINNLVKSLLSKFIGLLFRRTVQERLRACYRNTLILVTQKQNDCFREIAHETNQTWAMVMLAQLRIDSKRGEELLENAKAKYLQPERLSEALADLEAANQEFSRLLNQLKQVYANTSTP